MEIISHQKKEPKEGFQKGALTIEIIEDNERGEGKIVFSIKGSLDRREKISVYLLG